MRIAVLALVAGCSLEPSGPPPQLVYGGQRFAGPASAVTVAAVDNEALVFHVFDLEPSPPPQTFAITAPGWRIERDVNATRSALFHAIALATGDATFTVTSTAGTAVLEVEIAAFATSDPDRAPVFYQATAAECTCGGSCGTSIATERDTAGAWGSVAPAAIAAPAAGFSLATDAGATHGEYEIGASAGGTPQPIAMTTTPLSGSICELTALGIAPY